MPVIVIFRSPRRLFLDTALRHIAVLGDFSPCPNTPNCYRRERKGATEHLKVEAALLDNYKLVWEREGEEKPW